MLRLAATIKGLGAIIGIILGGALTVSPATAAMVTYNFTGAVSRVDMDLFTPGLGNNFNAGQTLSGFYTFDHTISDSEDDLGIGRYNGTIQKLEVKLGPPGYTAMLGQGSNFIEIRNDGSSGDRYIMQAPVVGSSVMMGEFSPVLFRLELTRGTEFNSDPPNLMPGLPTAPPSLSSFASSRWRLVFEDGNGDDVRIQGSLTSVVLATPVPAAVMLFGAGLIALVGLGAGSWQQRKNNLA